VTPELIIFDARLLNFGNPAYFSVVGDIGHILMETLNQPEFRQNKRQNFKCEQRSHNKPQVFWRSRPFSVLTEASDAGSSDAYHSVGRLFLTPTRSLPASNANARNYSLR